MAWSSTAILSAVELVIYILLLPLIVFTAWKHQLYGILGHFYLFVFLVTRLVADGISIADRNTPLGTSTGGAVVNSIGLSPLLLAIVAIINETRYFTRSDTGTTKKEILMVELLAHIIVVLGVALLATGMVTAAGATSESQLKSGHDRAEAGAVILLLAWVLSCLWAVFTLVQHRRARAAGPAYKLLVAVLVSLPFLGARICYTIIYAFDHSPKVNPVTASFATKLILVVLVQLAVFLSLEAGLFASRGMLKQICDTELSNRVELGSQKQWHKKPGVEATNLR